MRTALLWVVLPVVAAAQIQVEITDTTATQAVLQIRGANSPCTIGLREATADGAVHPDVTASVDTERPDTITWRDGTRVITIGHQRANLALTADTEYYGTVSGCGTATFQFHTATPPLGATMPQPLPVNPSNWNNADFPAIDWSPAGRGKWYTDPITGVKLKLIYAPENFSRKFSSDSAFTYWAGGSGWSNPANAINGDTSTATTSNQNAVYFYPSLGEQWQDYTAIENIGVAVWGQCVSGSGADCDIEVGITTNPAKGFAGTPLTLRMPGSFGKVSGGSPHAAAGGVFPTAYPRPLFAGWGDVRITKDMHAQGSAGAIDSAVDGVLTINSPSAYFQSGGLPAHFQKTLTTGHHIYVQGSGCTTNTAPDICTVAAAGTAGSLQLSESSVNLSSARFKAFPWGVMVRKKTASGTVRVGIKHRMAWTANGITGTAGARCGRIERTDADGVKGHPCVIPESGASYYTLYFISNDGEVVRPISRLQHPSIGTLQNPAFSPSDGDVLYAFSGATLYKGEYTGDWKASFWDSEAGRYHINQGGDAPYQNDRITWTPALSPPLASQIDSKFPQFSAAPYGSWATGTTFLGVSGDMAFWLKSLGGQDQSPCLIAGINLLTGTVIDVFNTLEDSGPMAFGLCHSTYANGVYPNTVGVSLHLPNRKNATVYGGGPFRMQVEAVMVNKTWDTAKSLPWPINNTYDNQCPTGLPSEYTDFGAVGNQCVTLLVTGHPCNIAPNPVYRTQYGDCAWNAAYAAGPALRQGHQFVDPAVGGAVPGDSERFRVLSVDDAGDGKLKVVVQRNASRDYCCAINGTGAPATSLCLMSNTPYLTHTAQFLIMMSPGSKATCNSAEIHTTYTDINNGTKIRTELSRSLQGHATYGYAPSGLRFLSAGKAFNVRTFTELGRQPPVRSYATAGPKFNGVSSPIGTALQQYFNHSQAAATTDKTVFSFDTNAVNPGSGLGGNIMGNGICQGQGCGSSGSRTFERVVGDVWRIEPLLAVDYKNRPLLGWSGQKVLKDVSGPSSDLSAAADYTFCYAYRAGECVSGSSQGQSFIKVPNVYRPATSQLADVCQTGMEFAQTPCLMSGVPAAGYIRQFRSDRPDVNGADQRLVTSLLRPYGSHFPYLHATAHPAGNLLLAGSGGNAEGIRQPFWLVKLPPFSDTTKRRNTLGGLTVKIGRHDGITHARVRFGYNTSFHCTERAEACLTDVSVTPFAFEKSDTTTATGCSGGCVIEVPAMPGRLIYYRIETFDGSVWSNGETLTDVP